MKLNSTSLLITAGAVAVVALVCPSRALDARVGPARIVRVTDGALVEELAKYRGARQPQEPSPDQAEPFRLGGDASPPALRDLPPLNSFSVNSMAPCSIYQPPLRSYACPCSA